ncbi:hypothetical protein [Sphingomonas bacterium]|uniref:hypothetical protein n=1 Tax=Sphingomonas bacterium TaxID=1895847 RepID=UPI001575B5C9|nr:hypothetical protein [Sphingomonas bacterium]
MDRPAPLPLDTWWFRLAVLTATALAARAVTFGSPVVHVDETFYLTVAQAMTHGALPYVDLWDRKPIGLFLLYLPAAVWGLPAALYVYQAMAMAAAVATAVLITRLADRAGWRAGALPAAMLYILWLDLADGQGGQSPIFYNLPMAGAALLALQGSRGRAMAAMLLVGLALQIKYSVLFEGVGLGLWLLASDLRSGRRVGETIVYALMLGTIALLPTALAMAAYAMLGHLDAFIFANFVSILHRSKDSPALMIDRAGEAAAILSLLLFAIAGWRAKAEPLVRLFLHLWLLVALVAFVGFGGWYNHYTLPVMLPGAVCAAAFFQRRARSWWWIVVPLALLFVTGQVVLRSERERRGTAAQFQRLTATVGRGPGGLFVYSGPVLLYPATGRPALTRYLFPSHLQFDREAGSIGVDQRAEIERIFAQAPAAVVMAPAIGEEEPAMRTLVEQRLSRDGYVAQPSVRLGHDDVVVFRRPTSSPSRPAAR